MSSCEFVWKVRYLGQLISAKHPDTGRLNRELVTWNYHVPYTDHVTDTTCNSKRNKGNKSEQISLLLE